MDKGWKLAWVALAIGSVAVGYYKLDKYLDAQIAYASSDCSDRAYMIYKQYDDQIEPRPTQDWSSRITECAEIEAEYMSGF